MGIHVCCCLPRVRALGFHQITDCAAACEVPPFDSLAECLSQWLGQEQAHFQKRQSHFIPEWVSTSLPPQSVSVLDHSALLPQGLLCRRSPLLHVRRRNNAALWAPLQNGGLGHCFLFLFCFAWNNSPLRSHFGTRNRLLINLTALDSPSQMLAWEGEKKIIYNCIKPFHPREPSEAHVAIIHRRNATISAVAQRSCLTQRSGLPVLALGWMEVCTHSRCFLQVECCLVPFISFLLVYK